MTSIPTPNLRLVKDEDDNGKFELKKVNNDIQFIIFLNHNILPNFNSSRMPS